MTLLIETISRDHALLTADGLCRSNPITGVGTDLDDLQKIFPLSNLPMAIAHHGFNIIHGKEIAQLINEFEASLDEGLRQYSVQRVAENLRDYADTDAKSTLANPTNQGVIGFWITGFSSNKSKPECYEIVWPSKPVPQKLGSVVFGGSGQEFINRYLNNRLGQFDLRQVNQFSRSTAALCHDALYKAAEATQNRTGQRIFGGHQHRLLINKNRWEWMKRPRSRLT
jgi:hypothetical protein